MAISGPLSGRRRVVLVDLETERGTGVTPTTPLDAFDPRLQITAPFVDRKPHGVSAGHRTGVVGERTGEFTCKCELRGDGDASDGGLDGGLAVMMQCCGWKLSAGVYSPQSIAASQNTCSIWSYEDGRVKKLSGCSGTFEIEGEYGKPVSITFTMSGVWITPADVALPTPTRNSTVPPRLASCTYTLDAAAAPYTGTVRIDAGSQVMPRSDITAAAGVVHYFVGDRDPSIALDFEAATVANHGLHAALLAHTTVALILTIGASAGNIITIAAPALQYKEIGDEDRDGILIDPVTCVPTLNNDAGDDELTITPA